jgi:NarL family two-component system response regulator LiaR
MDRPAPPNDQDIMLPDTDAGPAELRTILADDDPLARRVIRDTLQAAGITVVAEAANGREAVELAVFYRPDVVLMDYMMPEVDGLEATRRLRELAPDVRVIILTGAGDEDLGLRGLGAGASGYLTKDVELTALPRAIRGARAGEAAISRRLTMRLVERYRREYAGRQGLRPIHSPLTDREWEVMDLLCAGEGTEEIARALVLSSETVRSHLKRIYRKLGVRSRADAVAAAQRLRDDEPLAA